MLQGSEIDTSGALDSPKNVYLAILNSSDEVRGVSQLLSTNLQREQVNVIFDHSHDEDFEYAEAIVFDSSSPSEAVRKMFAADEVEIQKNYHKAIQKGFFVLQVNVPEEEEELRNSVEKALLERGARYIHYFGQLTFEQVIAGNQK